MSTPFVIPDKSTRELGNNVNPTKKRKLEFSHIWTFYVLTFFFVEKVGEKQSIMSLSM